MEEQGTAINKNDLIALIDSMPSLSEQWRSSIGKHGELVFYIDACEPCRPETRHSTERTVWNAQGAQRIGHLIMGRVVPNLRVDNPQVDAGTADGDTIRTK